MRPLPWLLLVAVAVTGCKVTGRDVEEWKGTVKGPGKIVAVMLADKYDLDLRTEAALGLVEMQRQDVNGVQELQKALKKVDGETRSEILSRMLPGLEKLMTTADPEAEEGAGPSPLQIRAKDAAFLLVNHADQASKQKLTELVVQWYVEDFNGRSLAGSFSAEQVVRDLGAPAAAMLVDALSPRLPQQALVKLAELVAQVGSDDTKRLAGERLVAIEQEMEEPAFVEWIMAQINEQLEEQDQGDKVEEERVRKMAEVNQHIFIIDGALTAMRHLADQPKVAERLLELAAATATDARTTERRTRSLQALEGKARPEHLDVLLKVALDASTPVAVRDHAFDRVGDIRSPAAIPPMWPLVQDGRDQRLRWRAGELVLAIGGSGVLAEFFSKLPGGANVGYPPEELEGYATRMGQMNPLPTTLVAGQLRSADWSKRVIALRFFERKGNEGDVAALQTLANDNTSVSGTGWPNGHTVGKVAEAAIAALRQRLKEGSTESAEGSST